MLKEAIQSILSSVYVALRSPQIFTSSTFVTFSGVKLYVGAWTGLIWLRIGTGCRHLYVR
jgi:hypothetical protein